MSKFLDYHEVWNRRVRRFYDKIKMSKTEVPGFIAGLSGTDSIVAFLLAYDAMQNAGKCHRMIGVHYRTEGRNSWFVRECFKWLQWRCPHATFIDTSPRGVNEDQQRWADLHLRALYNIDTMEPHPPGMNYWVLGSINATERALGKYSALSNTAAVQPIWTMWKTEVLQLCRERLNVPLIAIENARLPDCACGREEVAAHNIEMIDRIIQLKTTIEDREHPQFLEVYDYVAETTKQNDFKQRVPYTI